MNRITHKSGESYDEVNCFRKANVLVIEVKSLNKITLETTKDLELTLTIR